MTFRGPPQVVLYVGCATGLTILVAGVALGVNVQGGVWFVIAVVLQTLGSSILFPILVSFAYDRIRERWLGDEVWRIFAELADAGIVRIYRDREFSPGRPNAATRLSDEFRRLESGQVYMMGPTLRVFFNPVGQFYRDIEGMLRSGHGRVHVNVLIQQDGSPAIRDRIEAEEPDLAPGEKAQGERDADSSVAAVKKMSASLGPCISFRRFMPAPYCTAVIFPHVAFFSPNLLVSEVPVRMPMILFRSGSHGYTMLRASFEYLWRHPESVEVLP